LDAKVDVLKHISKMANTHSVLRIWTMMWCQSHLCGCS